MTHWHAAGFGTDPEGDAARRAQEGVVELPDGTRVAGAPPAIPMPILADAIRRTAHLVPPSADEVEEVLGAEVAASLDDGLTRPLLDDLAGLTGSHSLTRTEYPWGIAVVCACGQWECVVTGPSSAAWAEGDYRRHRTLAG